MAKKGKMKISKVKRNNHTTNKMRKQGAMKLQRHRPKVQKQKGPAQPQIEYSSDSDSASGEDWADMLDEEEQAYIMNRIAKDSKLLSSVPQADVVETKTEKPKKRKHQPKAKQQSDSGAETDSDASVEGKYEKHMAEQPAKKMRALLPIKSKAGLVEREVEEDDEGPESDNDTENKETKMDQSETELDSDSGMEVMDDESQGTLNNGEVTTIQLMAERKDMLNKEKLRIGALCSSLIETPEKKLKNFFPILYLMEEQLKDGTLNMHSIRKIATLSAFEVFKDILPDYMIRHQDYSNIKLKKDTLSLYKFEKELLEFYKRYLQRLEKATAVLRPKKGDTRKPDPASLSLAIVSLRCMCGLLTERPQFNYAINIAQSVVPLLGCRLADVRDMVSQACSQIFKEDKKGDVTLSIVRLINQLVKKRGDRLPPSALHCLLDLRIKNIELDAETDLQHKQKQDEKHKKRIVNLSKKEKKRAKKLKEVERELLETQAQESDIAHKKQMTEVTKTVFHIYFRILKNSPHSKLLSAVLEGLAKFTHVINLEYYTELLAILAHLMSDDQIGRRERLLCVKTALSILAGSGDALNVDPARFHAYLYEHMIFVCSGKSHKDAEVVLNSVHQISRRVRQVSSATLQAMAKRLATLALQSPHHGTLAGLLTLYNMAQQSKQVHSLFDSTQEAIGSGRFDPFLPSPEHCNAHSSVVYELTSLSRHYHPVVRSMTQGLMAEPISLAQEFSKMNPMQVLKVYDGSQMCFKPAIPPPKPVTSNTRLSANHIWKQPSLKTLCENVEQKVENVNFSDLLKR